MGNRCRGMGGHASFTQTNSPPQACALRQPVACGPAETCQTSWGASPLKALSPLPHYPDPKRSMKAIFHLCLQCHSCQTMCVSACVCWKETEEREKKLMLSTSVHNKWKIGGLVNVRSWRNAALCCKFVSWLSINESLSLCFQNVQWLFI